MARVSANDVLTIANKIQEVKANLLVGAKKQINERWGELARAFKGSIRTYLPGESRARRAARIRGETDRRLEFNRRIERKHNRCTKCGLKAKSKAHRCQRQRVSMRGGGMRWSRIMQ
jgi:hypothetical protein